MAAPPADVAIDEQLVRALLVAQCPDLAALPLGPAAAGWDNDIWHLGDDLAVRLPRRKEAVPLLLHEQRWLPVLAPELPLPVPVPVRRGVPSERFGRPWSVVPWIDGSPGDRTPPTRTLDAALSLGRFLRALHRPAPADAPGNPWRGVPLATRRDAFDRYLLSVPADPATTGALRQRWAEAVTAPAWAGPPTWIHGDLHPANTVVRMGTLAGVVDFGDCCAGDPATDLAAAWLLLPLDVHPALWDAYGADDTALRRRAAGWAALFAVLLHGSVGGSLAQGVAAAAIDRLTS